MESREHFAPPREWESVGLTSRGFLFFFPLSLSLSLSVRGFPVLSALSQGYAVVGVDNRAMCEGLPGCKGNRANVSRPRGEGEAHAHASRSF